MAFTSSEFNQLSADFNIKRLLDAYSSGSKTARQLYYDITTMGYTPEAAMGLLQYAPPPPTSGGQPAPPAPAPAPTPFNPNPIPTPTPTPVASPTSSPNRVMDVLTAFRTSAMTPQALYDQLRSLGYSAELAQHTVTNETASRSGGSASGPTGATLSGVAGGPGLLGGGASQMPGSPDTPPTGGALGGAALEFQPQEDIYRRVGQERFGPRNALSARVLNNLSNQYDEMLPILDFGTDVKGIDRAAGFRQFLNNRPSGADLGQRLAAIMANGDPRFIEGTFAPGALPGARASESGTRPLDFDMFNPAFSSGLAPLMQRLSPFVRSGVARAIEDDFRQQFANNPDKFTSARSIFDELQRRNYIPRLNTPTVAGQQLWPGAANVFSGNLFGG